MIIYLMVKTHTKTGLKYLCKTTKTDFRKYSGSGVDWKQHLNEHGHIFDTHVVMECKSKEELKKWGLFYSELWNVVESPEWANRIPETGCGAGNGMKGKTYAKECCKFCHRSVSSSMIEFHEKACSLNPDRVDVFPPTKCQFCNEEFAFNTVKQHEKTCYKNPNKVNGNIYGLVYQKQECRFCKEEHATGIGIINHEASCSLNPNRTAGHNGGKTFDKIECEFCNQSFGAITFDCHVRHCHSNPNRIPFVKKFALRVCPHCGKAGKGPNMGRYHFENCKHNPDK